MILSIAITLASAYLLVAGAMYVGQERLLFYPVRSDPGALSERAQRAGLVPWLIDGQPRGWIANAEGARGTVLIFCGNAGMAIDRQWYVPPLAAQGWRVIIHEYAGYGVRGAMPLSLQTLLDDASDSVNHARAGNANGTLVVLGESLGAGIGSQVAARNAGKIARLVLITPWDSLSAVASHHYPWLPVGLILKNPMDSVAALQGFAGPIRVAIAENDTVIPSAHGERLARALNAPAERMAGAAHNDWMDRVDKAFWERLMLR